MAVDVRCNMFKAGANALAFFLFLAEIAESAEIISAISALSARDYLSTFAVWKEHL